jgi:hypothetical protein
MTARKHLHDAACGTVAMETTWMLQHPHFMQMAATNDHDVSCLAFALFFLDRHVSSSNEWALHSSTALPKRHVLFSHKGSTTSKPSRESRIGERKKSRLALDFTRNVKESKSIAVGKGGWQAVKNECHR